MRIRGLIFIDVSMVYNGAALICTSVDAINITAFMFPAHVLVNIGRVVWTVVALGALEATILLAFVSLVFDQRVVMSERTSARIRTAIVPEVCVCPVLNYPRFTKGTWGFDVWKRRKTVWSNSETTKWSLLLLPVSEISNFKELSTSTFCFSFQRRVHSSKTIGSMSTLS